jgi:hypothetical protein
VRGQSTARAKAGRRRRRRCGEDRARGGELDGVNAFPAIRPPPVAVSGSIYHMGRRAARHRRRRSLTRSRGTLLKVSGSGANGNGHSISDSLIKVHQLWYYARIGGARSRVVRGGVSRLRASTRASTSMAPNGAEGCAKQSVRYGGTIC